MKILVSILCGSERHAWLNPGLVKWMIAASQIAPVEFSFEENRWPVSHARNMAAQQAINDGADWHIQIDNDIIPHPNFLKTVEIANQRGLDFLSSVNALPGPDGVPLSNVCTGSFDGSPGKPENAFEDDLFAEVAYVGGGCFAVRVDVYRRLERPYFRIDLFKERASRGLGEVVGEDLAFCVALRQIGVRILTSKTCTAGHLKTSNLSQVFEKIHAPKENNATQS